MSRRPASPEDVTWRWLMACTLGSLVFYVLLATLLDYAGCF